MVKHPEAALRNKFLEAFKLMNVYLNHFPKFEKYGLCQEIRSAMYSTYSFFVEGYKSYHKKTTLSNLDKAHEKWRMLVNLAYDLGYFSFNSGSKSGTNKATKRFAAISIKIDELGRMIGGWIRKNNNS